MKVKMLKHVNGKVNGIQMGPYLVGTEYDLERERAELFIGSEMAEEIIPEDIVPETPVEPIVRRRR